MNGNFDNMIKRYSEELMKMSREKTLPDPPQEDQQPASAETSAEAPDESADDEEADRENEPSEVTSQENRQDISDIPGIEEAPFYRENSDDFPPFSLDDPEDFAYFSARIFTGNNAYPIENARVLVIKNNKLFTFLSTDSDGQTKRVKLPSYPESNSFDPENNEQRVDYTGEVYATGFTPRKGLLISAVGGSDIILDVQMTPIDERVK